LAASVLDRSAGRTNRKSACNRAWSHTRHPGEKDHVYIFNNAVIYREYLPKGIFTLYQEPMIIERRL
jgi:hypothetical protein